MVIELTNVDSRESRRTTDRTARRFGQSRRRIESRSYRLVRNITWGLTQVEVGPRDTLGTDSDQRNACTL